MNRLTSYFRFDLTSKEDEKDSKGNINSVIQNVTSRSMSLSPNSPTLSTLRVSALPGRHWMVWVSLKMFMPFASLSRPAQRPFAHVILQPFGIASTSSQRDGEPRRNTLTTSASAIDPLLSFSSLCTASAPYVDPQ